MSIWFCVLNYGNNATLNAKSSIRKDIKNRIKKLTLFAAWLHSSIRIRLILIYNIVTKEQKKMCVEYHINESFCLYYWRIQGKFGILIIRKFSQVCENWIRDILVGKSDRRRKGLRRSWSCLWCLFWRRDHQNLMTYVNTLVRSPPNTHLLFVTNLRYNSLGAWNTEVCFTSLAFQYFIFWLPVSQFISFSIGKQSCQQGKE